MRWFIYEVGSVSNLKWSAPIRSDKALLKWCHIGSLDKLCRPIRSHFIWGGCSMINGNGRKNRCVLFESDNNQSYSDKNQMFASQAVLNACPTEWVFTFVLTPFLTWRLLYFKQDETYKVSLYTMYETVDDTQLTFLPWNWQLYALLWQRTVSCFSVTFLLIYRAL